MSDHFFAPVTSETASQRQKANRAWLDAHAPALLQWIDAVNADQSVEIRSQPEPAQPSALYVDQECWLEQIEPELSLSLRHQLTHIDGIAVPRLANPPGTTPSAGALLAATVDQHHSVLLSALPNLMVEASSEPDDVAVRYRNVAVLGSLVLEPLARLLQSGQPLPWQGLVLVEDDPRQLAAVLQLVSFEALVSGLKAAGIGLTLVCETDPAQLRDRFFTLLSREQPLLLHGLQILRSPQRSPALMELHSWLHAPEGCQQLVLGMLGFATDELNQTLQAVWSARANRPARLLTPQIVPADWPVVLVASGPSLDAQLAWLHAHQHQLTIVAAGSALGSLIKAGITPAAVVYLERATDVYRQLCDLAAEGVDFSEILLFASSTLDPRVAALFEQSIVFHRPFAAASSFFPAEGCAYLPQAGPHVVNAALEVLLVLGCRRFLLAGCDFGTVQRGRDRAGSALGVSPRNLTMAVAGNKGRTVFSEPELLTAHHLFERMLMVVDGVDVSRLGEGVALQSCRNVDADDSTAAAMASDHDAFRECLVHGLPQAEVPSFEEATAAIAAARDNLIHVQELIAEASSWSHQLALALGALVSRDQPELSHPQRFAHALLAQPLFFLMGPLHAASPEQWALQQALAIESLQLLLRLVTAYGELLAQFLRIPRLPSWDPDWVRARCRSLDTTRPA